MELQDTNASENLIELVRVALGRGRRARRPLEHVVIPSLQPMQRLSAQRLLRHIKAGRLFSADAIEEIETLVRQIDREVATGSRTVFRANECDPSEGHVEVVQDDRAAALSEAVVELRALAQSITDALDMREALRLATEWVTDA